MRIGRAAADWGCIGCPDDDWTRAVAALRERAASRARRNRSLDLSVGHRDGNRDATRAARRRCSSSCPTARSSCSTRCRSRPPTCAPDSLDDAWNAYRAAWRAPEARDFATRCRGDPALLRHANETWAVPVEAVIQPDRIGRAIALYAVSFMIFPVSDALAKRLALRYPIAEIGAIRNGVHLVTVCGVACFWRRAGRFERAAGLAPAARADDGGYDAVPLRGIAYGLPCERGDAFVRRAVVRRGTFRPAAGRGIRFGQWLAVGAGFVGVALVFRPASRRVRMGHALGDRRCGLQRAESSRIAQAVANRRASGRPFLCDARSAPQRWERVSIFEWRSAPAEDFAVTIVMGLIATAGYFGVFRAIELASPARLAPFYYLQIITAVAPGTAIRRDTRRWARLGMTVIVGAGLICLGLERVRRRAPA